MSEVLARLAASTTNYGNVGQGGEPVLTKTEVSALLVGLNNAAVNYALAKYCDDRMSFKAIQLELMQLANQRAMDEQWRTNKGKPSIMSLGSLAVIESINPRLCFACHSPERLGVKACSCNKPRTKISHADRYGYVGLVKNSWVNLWQDRYEGLFNYCTMLDAEVNRVVRLNNRAG